MDINIDTLPILLATVLVLAMIGAFAWYISRQQKEKKRKEAEFVKLLLDTFRNKTISTTTDLIAFYESYFRVVRSKVRMYSDICFFLEQVQLGISSSKPDTPEYELISRLDEIRQLINSVSELLKEEEKRVPFYGTPEQERGLLEDILELTAADRTLVNIKLTRLAELIEARQETINVLGEEKGQARKLAYWGLAGTVVFGIVSIVLTIIQLSQK